ncbi:MAG TPA: hypothetical protein VEX68_20515 [Bryobacteraceae bacterium]|nr:hypothetical protein [Bryobacteraceae bacterium]
MADVLRNHEHIHERYYVKPRRRILSIRDNMADVRLIHEFWGADSDVDLVTMNSGDEALFYLNTAKRHLPNLILLASRYAGSHMSVIQILTALKTDIQFKVVPVVVLSAMPSPAAIRDLYAHQAACVIELPTDLDGIEVALKTIKNLWLHVARLPYDGGWDAS